MRGAVNLAQPKQSEDILKFDSYSCVTKGMTVHASPFGCVAGARNDLSECH